MDHHGSPTGHHESAYASPSCPGQSKLDGGRWSPLISAPSSVSAGCPTDVKCLSSHNPAPQGQQGTIVSDSRQKARLWMGRCSLLVDQCCCRIVDAKIASVPSALRGDACNAELYVRCWAVHQTALLRTNTPVIHDEVVHALHWNVAASRCHGNQFQSDGQECRGD